MKKSALIMMLACGVMLSACSGGGGDEVKQNPPTPSDPNSNPVTPGVVSFMPSLTAMTRATETAFELGDRIGVFAMKAATGDNRAIIASSGNYAQNVQYTYSGSKFTSTDGIRLPDEGKLFYVAVYPYQSQAANQFDFEVKTDQTSATSFTASDLCSASTDATDEKEVALKFNHRLSLVILNLTGDGWTSSNLRVKMKNVYTRAAVDLNNLTFTGCGTRRDVTCSPNGTNSYKVILPPQSISRGETMLVVEMNGKEYKLNTTGNLDFHSGKKYDYTINMSANGDVVIFTGDINPWEVEERFNNVIPEEIKDEMEPYIPFYGGTTPPNIEGTVFVDPFSTVYCQDYGNGGYAPGDIVTSEYIRFQNQNMIYNTLDMDEVSVNGNSSQSGSGAFISGSGDNFTVFFNTVGQSYGISTKTALIISGTKTPTGIADLKYAFVMVEKGSDPNNRLMKEGVFRVFMDGDGISPYTSWPGSYVPRRASGNSALTIYSFNK